MKKQIPFPVVFVSFFLLCATTIAFSQTPFWQQTNGPEGGNIWGLAINSQKYIFATTIRGGVYRSTDNGENWTPVNNGIGAYESPCCGAADIAVDPQDRLYVQNGCRIWRSVDNGENWVLTGFAFGCTDSSIAIRADGIIFAAAQANGVYMSEDHGDNWTQLINGLGGTYVTKVAVDTLGNVLAGTRDGLFRLTDGGISWSPFGEVLQGIEITALDVDPSTGDVFVGTYGYGPKNGAMFRYNSLAQNWTEIPNPGFWQAAAFAFRPGGQVFAGTYQNTGVWRSTDNGDTWEFAGLGRCCDISQEMRSVRALAISPDGTVFAGANGDGVFKWTGNGLNWIRLVHGMRASDVYSVLVARDGGVLAGTGGIGIFRSADEGGSWTRVNSALICDGWATRSMVMNSAGQIFAAFVGVSRSDDGGVTWPSPYDHTLPGCCGYALAVGPADEIYAGGGSLGVARSIDDGVSWKILPGLAGADIRSLAVDSVGRIFAGGINTGLWRSDDNGATWIPIGGFESEYYVKSIAISPNDDVFVSCLTRNAVLRSSDGGQTWVEVFAYNAAVIAINSEGRVFAGFDGAVLSSTDNGNTWQEVNDGLMNLSIFSFAFDADGYLYSGHWGGGVSRTTETTFLVKTVAIDIKPGVYPNTINLGSNGTVPVAILSSETFDATTVNPLTVTLAGANVRLKGKGTPMSSFEDINKDGRLDLLVHVETEALELTDTSTEAVLEGKTFSGRRIKGTDTVKVVP